MPEMTSVLLESKRLQNGTDHFSPDMGEKDEIEVEGFVFILGINRNTRPSGKDDIDPVPAASVADDGREVGEGQVLPAHDSGFPVRRGLIRGR